MLDKDAAELLLQFAGSPRKRGEFLSRALREWARRSPALDRLTELEREIARLRGQIVLQEARAGLLGDSDDGRAD